MNDPINRDIHGRSCIDRCDHDHILCRNCLTVYCAIPTVCEECAAATWLHIPANPDVLTHPVYLLTLAYLSPGVQVASKRAVESYVTYQEARRYIAERLANG